MPKLTTPEDRADRVDIEFLYEQEPTRHIVAREIRAALKELVGAYGDWLGSKTVGLSVLTTFVNEVLPEEEKIK